MSVRISLLKKSKQIVSNWLDENYKGNYTIFYSTGTKAKKFNDQFLKIQLDCDERKFPLFASKIRHELLLSDIIFSELKFKIFPI